MSTTAGRQTIHFSLPDYAKKYAGHPVATADLIHASIPRSVDLKLLISPDLPPVRTDATQLQQIIMNLVINGAEAIGESLGSVFVETAAQWIDEQYAATLAVIEEQSNCLLDQFIAAPIAAASEFLLDLFSQICQQSVTSMAVSSFYAFATP